MHSSVVTACVGGGGAGLVVVEDGLEEIHGVGKNKIKRRNE